MKMELYFIIFFYREKRIFIQPTLNGEILMFNKFYLKKGRNVILS